AVVNLIEAKPERFGPVRTGGPERPTHVRDHAPLVTTVSKEHPFETGHRARKGTEYR
ncbi:MAG: cobalamin adenosyltransferase, partial [Haloplanus sp.]